MTFDWTISVPVVISLLTVIYTFFRTRRSDVDDRFKQGSKRMDEIERRTVRLEHQIEHLPGTEEMHRMELALANLAGEMKSMSASQRATNDLLRRLETIVGRHEDHLLDGAKK